MRKGIIKFLSYVMIFAMIFGIVNIGAASNVNAAVNEEADMQLFVAALANTDINDRVTVVEMIANPSGSSYVFDQTIVPANLDDAIVAIMNPGSDATRVIVFNALTYMKSHYSTHSTYINYALTKLTEQLDTFAGKTLETNSNPLIAQVEEKFYTYNLFLNFLLDIKGTAANSPLFYDNNNKLELSTELQLLIAVAEGLGDFAPGGRYETYKGMLEDYLDNTNNWSTAANRTAFISDLKELGLCINKPTTGGNTGGGDTTTPPATQTNDAGTVTTTPTTNGGSLVKLVVDPAALDKKIAAATDVSIKLDLTAAKGATAVKVEIPDASFDKIVAANKTVTLQSEKATIILPVEVLKQIAQISTAGNISINIDIVKDAPAVTGSNSKSVADVMDFTITTGNSTVSSFDKPVTVTMKADVTKVSDYRKVSAYYYNETAKVWEAIGGFMNKTTGELTFTTNHFSKYTAVENKKTFADVSTPWAKDSIEVLAARNIMNGIGGDSFAPKSNITRAEVAAMLARALNLDVKAATGKFTDVASSKWYAAEVEAAANAGIITGVGNNKFAPDTQISREQIATMIYRALEYKKGKTTLIPNMNFQDTDAIAAYAKNAVAVAAHQGIVLGSNNKFMPKDNATREQVATMIYRMLSVFGEM